eukprot:TRINITY_DN15546_c0_g1_i2.p1 TRINITY_DN15546_c0_g1~~TRINITY_DN15546_c0_g1_i2.p1  ORF type:complete len:239 (-),score=53.96 TRINITY_DN15546_c0_g1_i2:112-828(-)
MITDVEVRICGLAASCQVAAEKGWTLRDVKRAVESETSVPAREQRLLFGDTELRDLDLVGKICEGDIVDLTCVRRPAEQAEWLEAVMSDPEGTFLADAPPHVCADREVVLAAVCRNGCALEFASDALRGDRDLALIAIAEDGNACKFVAGSLWADRDIVLAAVQRSGSALRWAVEEFRKDREVVLAAVEQDGTALRYADDRLRADRGVVMVAVYDNPTALKFAATELQTDAELIEAAG